MKYLKYLFVAILASSLSFVVHVFSVEWLQDWLSEYMKGRSVLPSWDVRYIAMLTSLEYGVAVMLLYWLIRDKIVKYGKFKAFLILSLLLLSLHGVFVRQPLMDFVIGNPIEVALIQNAFHWLAWGLMSLVVVYGYEKLAKKC